jgi:hypothetical protein
MDGTTCEMHPPASHLDEEEHIQCFKDSGLHTKEVAGRHLRAVLLEELEPGVPWHADSGAKGM